MAYPSTRQAFVCVTALDDSYEVFGGIGASLNSQTLMSYLTKQLNAARVADSGAYGQRRQVEVMGRKHPSRAVLVVEADAPQVPVVGVNTVEGDGLHLRSHRYRAWSAPSRTVWPGDST